MKRCYPRNDVTSYPDPFSLNLEEANFMNFEKKINENSYEDIFFTSDDKDIRRFI